MYIKQVSLLCYLFYCINDSNNIFQITIQGFKSYKNQTITDPFSPHHNVVGM